MRMTMFRAVVIAIVSVLLGTAVASATPILIHDSTEVYFDTGGTRITDNLNQTFFSAGSTLGNPTWQVAEKVYQDAALNTTTFTYGVANNTLVSNITAFTILIDFAPQSVSTPSWNFSSAGGKWTWTAAAGNTGIAQGTNYTSMGSITLAGLVPVGFVGGTSIISGITQSSETWLVSAPTPEPGTLLLLGTGIAAAGAWGRRKLLKTRAVDYAV